MISGACSPPVKSLAKFVKSGGATQQFIGHNYVFCEGISSLIDNLFVRSFSGQTAEEARKLKEEKRKTLLRKLSFRPTVEELKERKVFTVGQLFIDKENIQADI